MKKNKKVLIIILLIYTLFSFTGCAENKDEDLKTKVTSELDYVNVKTIDLLNTLNNISFENYSVISQQVKLNNEEQSQSGGESQGTSQSSAQGGQTSENEETSSGGSESQGSGGSSDMKGVEEKQEKEGESKDAINTTRMVANAELDKDRNDIEWIAIKKDIELLNESWAVIVLDLYALNVKNELILDFSDKLNSSMVAIKDEKKEQCLVTLADLYSSIPQFLEEIGADKNLQNIRQTQSHIINAYILAEEIENAQIEENLNRAIETYTKIMSNIDYTKDKTEKTNKIYVLLNELANSLEQKNTDVFYIKYKNLMKEIQAI